MNTTAYCCWSRAKAVASAYRKQKQTESNGKYSAANRFDSMSFIRCSIASRIQLREEGREEIESYCDGEDVASGAEGHEDGARPAAAAAAATSHRRGPRACFGAEPARWAGR
jgi:hypothetical protein